MGAFGDGLADLYAGRDTLEAEAASMNVAEFMTISADYMSEGRFSKGG
jgi:hypothetical protein